MKKAKAEIIGLIMRTLLTVLLVALEVCGVIAWPWCSWKGKRSYKRGDEIKGNQPGKARQIVAAATGPPIRWAAAKSGHKEPGPVTRRSTGGRWKAFSCVMLCDTQRAGAIAPALEFFSDTFDPDTGTARPTPLLERGPFVFDSRGHSAPVRYCFNSCTQAGRRSPSSCSSPF